MCYVSYMFRKLVSVILHLAINNIHKREKVKIALAFYKVLHVVKREKKMSFPIKLSILYALVCKVEPV